MRLKSLYSFVAQEVSHSPVTNSSIPAGCGGTQAESFGGNKARRSGGVRKVVTMTMKVTALNGTDQENGAVPDHLVSATRDVSVWASHSEAHFLKPFCSLSRSREGDRLASERLIRVLIAIGEDG